MRLKALVGGVILAAGITALLSAPATAEMACCKAGGETKSCCSGGGSCESGNASFFTATRCGMCAAHAGKKHAKHADEHPGHGGHAKMGCCVYVPCHEVGNRGFFSKTKHAGCCSAMGKCDHGACCGAHGKGGGHKHH